MRRLVFLALIVALMLPAGAALGQELIIGRGNEPQSIDPQFSRTGPNQMTAVHIFDRLVHTDRNLRYRPGLAESWRSVDTTTWEVKLRKGVTFHDGTPFTAEDVVFSLERVPEVPDSAAPFGQSLADLDRMEIVGDHTIRFITKLPSPRFIETIGNIYILSKAAAEGKTQADFDSGDAAIGTGPYKFVSWTPGSELVLQRNEDYWDKKPAFKDVTMRFIPDGEARVEALLSGAVDLIDLVPPAKLASLKADNDISVQTRATVRLVYLALNQSRNAPFLTDLDGNSLERNPFRDVRVRDAVSMMIDRSALVEQVLNGAGEPAGQLVPDGVFGHNSYIAAPATNLERAKELLAEAGYPDGFGITLHGSSDRFSQDARVAEAIGRQLANGGLKVNKVETLPYEVFAKAAGQNSYGAFLFSYGNVTGEASRGLLSVLHSFDRQNDLGTLNRFGYSNPEFDAAVVAAAQIASPEQREDGLQAAAAIAFGESAIVPLYFQSLSWASRRGIAYAPRRDERTLAMDAEPAD